MITPPYLTKLENTDKFNSLAWNIPEQKTGTINIIGGHSGGFFAPLQNAEYLSSSFPVKSVNLLLPDALKNKLPGNLPGLYLLPSTDSGSLAKSESLSEHLKTADFSILIGDLSKNSATTIALAEAIKNSDHPVLITRDSIDLLLPEMNTLIEKDNLFIVGSLVQIQKLFRAVYYPKMIMLSMPLLPAAEALHKFTLSYPITILTFHNGQILIANQGEVLILPLEKTPYSGQPIKLWSGDLACRIAALNLYNPNKKIEATTLATTYHPF